MESVSLHSVSAGCLLQTISNRHKGCCNQYAHHQMSKPHASKLVSSSQCRATCRATNAPSQAQQSRPSCRQQAAATLASGLLILSGGPAAAFDIPFLPGGPPIPESTFEERSKVFAESDFLRNLKERTSSNKAKNKKELQDKYCYRQAELGVGDCAGLRLIPGATKSGKQKTPEWLSNILGKPSSKEGAAQEAVPMADQE